MYFCMYFVFYFTIFVLLFFSSFTIFFTILLFFLLILWIFLSVQGRVVRDTGTTHIFFGLIIYKIKRACKNATNTASYYQQILFA